MPLSTELPVGDLYEFVGNFRLNGDGPPTTGRVGLARLQELMLASTSLVGARIVNLEGRMSTAEGFTSKVDSLLSRVTTLEGLAGISPGTDLAADGTAVRGTRYWPRPGEAIRTWTAAAAATAQAATPLTVGGAYSITTDGPGKGPALRITGNAYATSIAKTHLDDGEIVEFTFRIARRIDNTGTNAAANNVPVLEFRCYKADGTDNGTVALPTTALLAADPLRIVTYRACLTPGVGSVDLPANTRFISPLFGERGNGAIELTSADRSTQSLTSAPEMTDAIAPEDRLFIFDDSAKLIKKLSPLLLAQYVESIVVEKFYNRTVNDTITATGIQLLPSDPFRNSIDLINPSTTDTMIMSFGAPPSVGSPSTRILAPGEGYYREHCPTEALFVRSLGGSIPAVCDYTNSNNVDVLKYALADRYIAKSAYVPTSAEREILAKFFNRLRDGAVLPFISAAAILGAPSRTLALQDIVRDVTWRQINPTSAQDIPFTKYQGFTGNGTDQCLGSRYIPSQDAGRFLANSHGFGAFVNTGLQGTTPFVMGSYRTGLAPQRAVDSVGTRSASINTTVVAINAAADGGSGGYYGIHRNSADRYTLIHRKTPYDAAVAATSLDTSGLEMLVLAQATATGAPTAFSTLTPFFVWMGSYMPSDKAVILVDSVTELQSSFLALGA